MAASGNKTYKARGTALSVTTQRKIPEWQHGRLGEKLCSAGHSG